MSRLTHSLYVPGLEHICSITIITLVNHSDMIHGKIQEQQYLYNMVSSAFCNKLKLFKLSYKYQFDLAFVINVSLITLQFMFGIYCHVLQSSHILVRYIAHCVKCSFSLSLCNKDTQYLKRILYFKRVCFNVYN